MCNLQVLVKMRGDVSGGSEGIKQYMFVPSDDLPSDLDTTMDTTGDNSILSAGDTSLLSKKSGGVYLLD